MKFFPIRHISLHILTDQTYLTEHLTIEFSKPFPDLPLPPHLPGDGVARLRGDVLRRPRREGEPRHQDTRRPAGGLQGHARVS